MSKHVTDRVTGVKRTSHRGGVTRLLDLGQSGFVIEPRYYFFGWAKSPRLRARKSAVRALRAAQALLPLGYKFKIWDAHRPRDVELAMVESFRRRLRLLHPTASRSNLRELLERFGGQSRKVVSRLDTHRNGGSFDLTVVDPAEAELFMGTDHDDLTERAALDYYEGKKRLTPLDREARRNRRLLKRAMMGAGFRGYPPEWWHWSFIR